jgi:hypothetical protein
MAASASDFRKELIDILRIAEKLGCSSIELKAGNLHRRVGGYPGQNHRMPVCCEVMRKAMKAHDSVVEEPKKGLGASLKIRYLLPR